MKTFFTTLLLAGGAIFCAISPVFSQNLITGRVQNTSGNPIPFANVLLLTAADSALVGGSFSSETGNFIFENLPIGNFLCSFSMIGFETQFSKTIVFTEKGKQNNLETIVLKENTTLLGEVMIVAKRPFLEQKIDRTVVNVANSITNAGGNALEILTRAPGVQVNRLTKTIALAGKQGVVVMINGKISRQPTEAIVQMLEGMNADNIDRIELIHTPPANFEAEGNAGIINIILKNTGDKGLNGGYSANVGYGRAPKYGAGAYFNFRKNKVNFFGNYAHNFNLNPQVFTNYRRVVQGNNILETETFSDRPHTPTTTQDARFGVDFQISKKTVFGVLGSFFDRNWYMEAVNNTKYSENAEITGRLTMPNSETNHNRSLAGNMNLSHQFSKNKTLNLDADFVNYDIQNPSHYHIQNLDVAGNISSQNELRIAKKTPIRIAVGKADYSANFGKNMQFEAGAKTTSMRFDNDVRVERREPSANWLTISDLTSVFHLNEDVVGFYSTFSGKMDAKTDIKTGLRYEYTRTNLGSVQMPNVVDRQYGSWFPSIFVGRKLSETQNLNFSCSRRISRPKIRNLAPWLIFSDPTTLESGNPALQPSFTNAFKLDYARKTIHFGVSYSVENNPIRFVPRVNAATNQQVNQHENLKNEKVATADLSFPLHPTKFWEIQSSFFANLTEINFESDGKNFQLSAKAVGFNLIQTFTLPKKISLELSGNYNSPNYWGVAKWRANGAVNLGLQKDFGQKWGKLRLNANDLFLSSNWFGKTSQPEINLLVHSSFQFAERVFMISYSNTFGNRILKSARNRQTGSAEEMRRI